MVAVAADAPLPSWNDGKARNEIVNFVNRVTTTGSPDFVPAEERIAVFDNDGTLWAEKPVPFQFLFAIDEIKRLAPKHLGWKKEQPYRSVLAGDLKGIEASGEEGLLKIMMTTHAGMTTDAFAGSVSNWLKKAKHPVRKVPYTDLVYQPQLELLSYLRSEGFKTYIVSGGGVEFIRVFAEQAYGIPPEQVVGSAGLVKYQNGSDGKPELVKEPRIDFVDDGAGKPVGINRFIGRRPIMAVGNSDGDLQMLEYTADGPGARLAVYVHHDDAAREYAYDRKDRLAKLDRGLNRASAKGWVVISMKNDWKTIFPAPK